MEHLAKEIIALEAESSRLAQRLEAACARYLDALRTTLPRQLVQACYVLCTQVHPQVFLQLNFDQRHQLQQQLKQVGEDIAATLTLDRLMKLVDQLAAAKEQEFLHEQESVFSAFPDLSEKSLSSDVEPSPGGSQGSAESVAMAGPIHDEAETTSQSWWRAKPPTDPRAIAQWLQVLSEIVRRQLIQASHAANVALQKAQIFESQIPLEILEAKRASDPSQGPSGPPNLLKLMVSKPGSDHEGELQIVAVDLRLPEIEFTDPRLMDLRRELQTLMQELRRLEQRYTERQRQWAIAQAETAWRSSWPRD